MISIYYAHSQTSFDERNKIPENDGDDQFTACIRTTNIESESLHLVTV